MDPLLDGSKLASFLDHLLGNGSSQIGTQPREFCSEKPAEALELCLDRLDVFHWLARREAPLDLLEPACAFLVFLFITQRFCCICQICCIPVVQKARPTSFRVSETQRGCDGQLNPTSFTSVPCLLVKELRVGGFHQSFFEGLILLRHCWLHRIHQASRLVGRPLFQIGRVQVDHQSIEQSNLTLLELTSSTRGIEFRFIVIILLRKVGQNLRGRRFQRFFHCHVLDVDFGIIRRKDAETPHLQLPAVETSKFSSHVVQNHGVTVLKTMI
mmetsp:Transcript_66649/g.117840  ORF Transcript_66649/g.117840 Transcript_66649/m.117840 type:complete len:270 (-) Transcript_66649:813-1622(-)